MIDEQKLKKVLQDIILWGVENHPNSSMKILKDLDEAIKKEEKK